MEPRPRGGENDECPGQPSALRSHTASGTGLPINDLGGHFCAAPKGTDPRSCTCTNNSRPIAVHDGDRLLITQHLTTQNTIQQGKHLHYNTFRYVSASKAPHHTPSWVENRQRTDRAFGINCSIHLVNVSSPGCSPAPRHNLPCTCVEDALWIDLEMSVMSASSSGPRLFAPRRNVSGCIVGRSCQCHGFNPLICGISFAYFQNAFILAMISLGVLLKRPPLHVGSLRFRDWLPNG